MKHLLSKMFSRWHPVQQDPPRAGDLIVMLWAEGDPLPGPGWTRTEGQPYLWRVAQGGETGFPGPALWLKPDPPRYP